MSEESYLDSLLKDMTGQEDISLSEEELNNLDISTIKDVELVDLDVSGISLDDFDIDGISELFVDSSALESEEAGVVLPEMEEESGEIDFALPEMEEESEEIDFALPEMEEESGKIDFALPEMEEESEEVDEIPLVLESKENEKDDFMDEVDGLLDALSGGVDSGPRAVQNDEPDSFFSLDGLMAMDNDDSFFEEESVSDLSGVQGSARADLDDIFGDSSGESGSLDDIFADSSSESFDDIFGDSSVGGEGSLDDDLMDILNEKSVTEEEKPAKKSGVIDKLFANIHDAKSKRAHEKMLSDEEKRALRKKEREEKKAAKKAKKEDPAYIAEQEAKKKEKEEKKAQAQAVKEAKKREKEELKKQRQAEEEAEAMKDQGRINRVGAAIVFVCLGAFAASVIFGSDTFSYNQSVANAKEYFGNREYTEAYNELRGVELKNEDIEMYDKVVTVMYVNKQLNSYNNYYAMQMYPEALDSLLKGLEKYDNHLEAAGQLGVVDDLDYVRAQIVVELQTVFSLNEKEAYAIIDTVTQEEYSQKVIKAAKNVK